jgi:large subunit ribosomal protein L6
MSRIGKSPISIPDNVEVKVDNSTVNVKGPLGELTKTFFDGLNIKIDNNTIFIERQSDEALYSSLHGLTRTLISNMVKGVSEGYQKVLEITGVGYRASKKGDHLELQIGFSHPVTIPKRDGIEIELPSQTRVVIKGIDKELVGQVAASIRSIRKPEPYKGKGIKYEGERIRRKVGKTGK